MATFADKFNDPFADPNMPKTLEQAHEAVRALCSVYRIQEGYGYSHLMTEADVDDMFRQLRPIIKKWEG